MLYEKVEFLVGFNKPLFIGISMENLKEDI